MPDYLNDAELILVALLRGVLTWEPSRSTTSSGTLLFEGVRHWTNTNDLGLPKISVHLRRRIIEKLAPAG